MPSDTFLFLKMHEFTLSKRYLSPKRHMHQQGICLSQHTRPIRVTDSTNKWKSRREILPEN